MLYVSDFHVYLFFKWKPHSGMFLFYYIFILLEKQLHWIVLSLRPLMPFSLPLISFICFYLIVFTFVGSVLCVPHKQMSIFGSCLVIRFLENCFESITVTYLPPRFTCRWRNWASKMSFNFITISKQLIAHGDF